MTNLIYIIYKHTCIPTGKSYIGQTSNKINIRWNCHKCNSITRDSNLKFHKAIRKHGVDNFTHEILFSTDNPYIINEKEIQLIAIYDTFHNGYNSTIGGASCLLGQNKGIPKSEKFKKSISGTNNYQFSGFYHTPKGIFNTAKLASNSIQILSRQTISRWCKNSDKIITPLLMGCSKYLQDLPESPLGKTFKEIGFWFIQK